MKYKFSLLFFIISLSLFSQFSETIDSDRPGFIFNANTVGKNVLQMQQGVGFNQKPFVVEDFCDY